VAGRRRVRSRIQVRPVTGDYVAHRVVGRDKQPELAPIFKIKEQTFSDATSRNPFVHLTF
jgi:hypothetical protein